MFGAAQKANGILATIQRLRTDPRQILAVMAAIKKLLQLLHSDTDSFDDSHMREAMREMMAGNSTSAQTGALLSALELSCKSSNATIIAAAADVMLEYAVPCPILSSSSPVVDIVGTGGDGADAFNVSTAAGIVMAACGVTVAKHGNRSSSGSVGSADLLEAFGANVDLNAEQTSSVAERCGFGFLFAPKFHPAMKHVASARKELGFRTLFNLLGPLTNPAKPNRYLALQRVPLSLLCSMVACRQLIGVSRKSLGPIFAEIFAQRAGHVHTLIVHSQDGLDEISPSSPTHVWEVKGSSVTSYDIDPTMFGLQPHALSQVSGMDLPTRVAELRKLLQGQPCGVRSFVVLNAAAGLYVAGKAQSWLEGAQQV
jgi:anthranilate phosphoribosyltransferase